MAIDDMAKQASAGGESEVKFLTPLDINTKSEKKYCRFKKYGIKHVDYKDADFLLQFVNEQGKILPRRYTGTSLKYQRKVSSAIKRARHLALMPYVADLLKQEPSKKSQEPFYKTQKSLNNLLVAKNAPNF